MTIPVDRRPLTWPVTKSTYSWREIVVLDWGVEWNDRYVKYEFPPGIEKFDDDNTSNGVYRPAGQ